MEKRAEKKHKKGFTLIELIVAIAIVLLIGAAVTPMLLTHLKDAKVAATNENLIAIKTAFDSAYTKNAGVLVDEGSDGNYLDDIYNEGWLSKLPSDQVFSSYQVKRYSDANNNVSYYIQLANEGADSYDMAKYIVSQLDKKLDNDNGNAQGAIQWNDSNATSTVTAFYLLYAEPGMSTWHE